MINIHGQQSTEVLRSELYASHLPQNQPILQGGTPLAIASGFLVQKLVRRHHDCENFLRKLKVIGQHAQEGHYQTIRKLELELIRAGKVRKILEDYVSPFTPRRSRLHRHH